MLVGPGAEDIDRHHGLDLFVSLRGDAVKPPLTVDDGLSRWTRTGTGSMVVRVDSDADRSGGDLRPEQQLLLPNMRSQLETAARAVSRTTPAPPPPPRVTDS